ncbi:unnamed protein product [Rangifer tarandus platyrhynchus]|uniref:Uncharacterized protein n=1 Tax=Rangifer tarandus platyrhynchus TaxID=3082113 RepID=A0AC59ZF96_RANTA
MWKGLQPPATRERQSSMNLGAQPQGPTPVSPPPGHGCAGQRSPRLTSCGRSPTRLAQQDAARSVCVCFSFELTDDLSHENRHCLLRLRLQDRSDPRTRLGRTEVPGDWEAGASSPRHVCWLFLLLAGPPPPLSLQIGAWSPVPPTVRRGWGRCPGRNSHQACSSLSCPPL